MKPGITITVLLGSLLIFACSAKTKQKWLPFFFDGVPSQEGEPASGQTPPEGADSSQSTSAPKNAARAQAEARTVHPPYTYRECGLCHASRFSQTLKGEADTLCLSCHSELFDRMEVKHFPAEEGACMSCHDPHGSPRRNLLIADGKTICVDCHDPEDLIDEQKHGRGEVCHNCHNPHGGKDAPFLKQKPLSAAWKPSE